METYDNIPCVDVDSEGGYKFILVRIGQGDEARHLVWAKEGCGYHRDVLAHFSEHYDIPAWCVGGGQIRVDPEEKQIKVWGSSGDFGWPDYELVCELLEQAFEGWTIDGPSR